MNEEQSMIANKMVLNSIWNIIKRNIVVILIIIFAAYTASINPKFVTLGNFQNIVRQLGALSITSIGMTFIIISGYFDLSIVGMFSLTSVVSISMITTTGEIPAIILGLCLGILCGLAESLILVLSGAKDGADATFITFGIGTAYGALALIFCKGQSIRLYGDTPIMKFIGWGKFLGIPASFYIFVLTLLIANFFLTKTEAGISIRMMGGNREATRLTGISINKNIIIIYTILGFSAALGGIINYSRTTIASAGSGAGYEVNSLLAVIIGGTRLNGGVGGVYRTFIGVLLVVILENALNLLGMSSFMKEAIKGGFLILAIWLDYRRK